MLDNGVIHNCPYTSADLRAARNIHGPCIACARSKLKQSLDEESYPPASAPGENIATDLHDYETITIGGNKSALLGVDEFSGYMLAASIPSTTTVQLQTGQAHLTASMNAHGHRVNRFSMDHQSNLVKTKRYLNQHGILHSVSTPENHQRLIERYVQTRKAMERAILNSLNYQPSSKLDAELLHHTVKLHNATTNSKSSPHTPMWIVEHRKPIMRKFAWGQPGIFTIQKTTTPEETLASLLAGAKIIEINTGSIFTLVGKF